MRGKEKHKVRHERKKPNDKKKKNPTKCIKKIESNSSLLEIGPSSAAEEIIWVVSKHGCYMFS